MSKIKDEDFPGSLNPTPEQILYEKLALEKWEYEFMQAIRRHMKIILSEEKVKREKYE